MMAKPSSSSSAAAVLLLMAAAATTPAWSFLHNVAPSFTRPTKNHATARMRRSAPFFATDDDENQQSSDSSHTDADFTVGVLGDLHLDPREMQDYETGRAHWLRIFGQASSGKKNAALVSLGDLGESQAVDPAKSSELFSGTTACHQLAARYLQSFGVPYELVGGNHDLEGIDEFQTDQENLEMMLKVHNKPTPQFLRKIADKTLLVGLTSTVFRDAKYTSHEVTIDQEQLEWFEDVVQQHPAHEGWKIFVFTHAPPLGSGLKVLPENHVVNGCCWLNHSNQKESLKFIELVREHRCIKAWFSGHFHLGQNYQQSITLPNNNNDDDDDDNTVDRGSCVFVQTSVMRSGTSRDGSQQSRLIRGNKDGFEICTVDHQRGGTIRLDATVTYSDCDHEVGVYAAEDDTSSSSDTAATDDNADNNEEEEEENKDTFVQVYTPRKTEEDDALYPSEEDLVEYENFLVGRKNVSEDTTAWWYLKCGRVLGIFNGMLLEYDPSTLAPLGLVVGADELVGKRIAVIDAAAEENDEEVQAVVLIDETDGRIVVVQPNEDGSYWRKIVRNKLQRMRERRREEAAAAFVEEMLNQQVEDVVSTWGPYTTTSGTAKKTGVEGLTVPHPAEKMIKKMEIEEVTTAPTSNGATNTTTLLQGSLMP